MKLSMLVGSTSQTINIFIRDSSSTTGAGLTGLAYNTASLTAYYGLPRAAAVAITLATQTVTGAWSSGGFVEISATNMPGWYRFDIPDAALASGRSVSLHLKGATNMAPIPIEIELTAWNNQDGVHGGMSAIPNAAPGAANGVFIAGTNAATAVTTAFTTTFTGNLTGSVGSVTGAVGSVTGAVGSVTGSVGSVTGLTASDVGAIKAKTDNLPAAPASTTNITAGTITTVTNVTNAPTAGDFTTTMKTSIGTAVAASAVASVTGNVGGNVVGSVGSVTGLTASDVGAIKAKTDNLPSDPADQSLIIAATDAIIAAIAALNNLSEANVRTAIGMAGADLDSQLDAILAATGGGSPVMIADGAISEATFTVPSDGTGQATGILAMILWLYKRFYGKVIYDSNAGTIKTYQANGTTVRTTQVASSTGSMDEVDAAT